MKVQDDAPRSGNASIPEEAEGVGLAKKSASSPRAAFSLARKSAMGSSDIVYELWLQK